MDQERFTPEGAESFIAPENPETAEKKEQDEQLKGEAAFLAAFKGAREKFTKEFGLDVATKLQGIENIMRDFVNKLRVDFQKEHEYSEITPDAFIAKYNLGTHEGTTRGADIREYALKTAEEWKQKKQFPIGEFNLPIFQKMDSKGAKREFPYVGKEWKPDEVHEETFTPKQEELLYQLLTGSPDSVTERAKQQDWHTAEFPTTIPGMKLALHAESGPSNRDPKKPIQKSVGARNYGWKERSSNLSFDEKFIKEVLEQKAEA